MTRIAPKPIIRTVLNKHGEEIIEKFDKKGKLEKWFNPSRNINAEINHPTETSYESFIADENNYIYKTKEVDKYSHGYASVRTKKLDLSEYPILKVAIAEKTYANGIETVKTDIHKEIVAPNDVNKDSLVELFMCR